MKIEVYSWYRGELVLDAEITGTIVPSTLTRFQEKGAAVIGGGTDEVLILMPARSPLAFASCEIENAFSDDCFSESCKLHSLNRHSLPEVLA